MRFLHERGVDVDGSRPDLGDEAAEAVAAQRLHLDAPARAADQPGQRVARLGVVGVSVAGGPRRGRLRDALDAAEVEMVDDGAGDGPEVAAAGGAAARFLGSASSGVVGVEVFAGAGVVVVGMACLGMRRLKEAVLEVLVEAVGGGECPGVAEISGRAGIRSGRGVSPVSAGVVRSGKSMRQLEEAVLEVLVEAERNGECPGVAEISGRAGARVWCPRRAPASFASARACANSRRQSSRSWSRPDATANARAWPRSAGGRGSGAGKARPAKASPAA